MNLRGPYRWLLFLCLTVLIIPTVIPQFSSCQEKPAASAPPATPMIHAVLEKIVHPKRVKVGDAVIARMTETTRLKNGTELPKGTHILGKVTDIKLKADKEAPSRLGLLFDKAQLKDGKEIPIAVALVSIAPPWGRGSANSAALDNGGASGLRDGERVEPAGMNGGNTDKTGAGGASQVVTDDSMRVGICYVPDMTIATYSMGAPGTILQSSKTTVYLDSGTRLLLLPQ